MREQHEQIDERAEASRRRRTAPAPGEPRCGRLRPSPRRGSRGPGHPRCGRPRRISRSRRPGRPAVLLAVAALAAASPLAAREGREAARTAGISDLSGPPAYEAALDAVAAAGTAHPELGDDPFPGLAHLEREDLVRAVLERNRSLEAARRAWEAAVERYPQVTSLSDPTLGYSIGPLSLFDGDIRFGQVLEVGQRLPYPGKLRLRGEAALAEAAAARAELEEARLDLALAASSLFDRWYVLARGREIHHDHLRLLGDFLSDATSRYAAGLAEQQDPLQAEVELAHVEHRDVALAAQQEVVEAQMNALLHRRPSAPLPPPPPRLAAPAAGPLSVLALLADETHAGHGEHGAASRRAVEGGAGARPTADREAPSGEPAGSASRAAAAAPTGPSGVTADTSYLETRGLIDWQAIDALAEEALERRPEIAAALAAVRARGAEVELAQLAARPDFQVGASYNSMWNEIEHRIMVGASVNLPLYRRRIRAGEAEAESRLAAARAGAEALALEIRAEVVAAAERMVESFHVLDLYESRLLPASVDQVAAARSSFESGRTPFLTLVDAERNLRSVELSYQEVLAAYHQRAAELERAVGFVPGLGHLDELPATTTSETPEAATPPGGTR